MTGHRAPGLPCDRGERADGWKAASGAVGEADEVLQRPVQMPAHGAVQIKGDRDKGKHGSLLGCKYSPPGSGVCQAHLACGKTTLAKFGSVREDRCRQTYDSPGPGRIC